MMYLFTKTWDRDFDWLKLAVISVLKNCTEEVHWTFVTDNGTSAKLKAYLDNARGIAGKNCVCNVFEAKEHWPDMEAIQNGYLRQQLIKMYAHRIMGGHLFWNWDSDVIAAKKFSSKDLCGKSGKPIYWITPLNSLLHGENKPAHEQRAQVLKELFKMDHVSLEYMRCMPIPMNGGILEQGARHDSWKKTFDLAKNSDHRISEFNIIGLFAHLYFPDAFEWVNTHHVPRTWAGSFGDQNALMWQGWSWGGVPPNVYQTIINM